MTFCEQVVQFNHRLNIKSTLPDDVSVLDPFRQKQSLTLSVAFYKKYYSDNKGRFAIFGINPGRNGGGLTGIPFTDPVALQEACHIENELPKKKELSSDFVYRMISAFGGPDLFYSQYFITAVSPLGFISNNKNLNYYEIKNWVALLEPYVINTINEQLQFPIDRKKAFCLGEGDNYKILTRLNEAHHFFNEIVPLPHPRFIMQYKRKHLDRYIQLYLSTLAKT